MSHRKVGKFVCLIAFIAGLGWSQAAAAATSERDRLEKMLEEAKRKLIYIDQYISEMEVKIMAAKVEVQWMAAIYKESGREEDHKAWLEALDQYQGLVLALEEAKANRAQVLVLIEYLKAKLRALGPAPRLGPAPIKGQPTWLTS